MADVTRIAATLVRSGKGLLAADESISTMNGRLMTAGVPATSENRRAYREMLVTTPSLAEGVSGVTLCDETFGQRLANGQPFPDALAARGLLAGIKVDTGAAPLAGVPGETVTEGLDGLTGRLAEYANRGARFAKWRAVFRIDGQAPTWRAVRANAHALTRYAALCHEAGLAPIVEPEVLMDGAHSAGSCSTATGAVLFSLFAELQDFEVDLSAVVLKVNMVLPGTSSGEALPPGAVPRAADGPAPVRQRAQRAQRPGACPPPARQPAGGRRGKPRQRRLHAIGARRLPRQPRATRMTRKLG